MGYNNFRFLHVMIKIFIRNQSKCCKVRFNRLKGRLHDNLFWFIFPLLYQPIKCNDNTPEWKLLCSKWDKQFNFIHSFQYVKERSYLAKNKILQLLINSSAVNSFRIDFLHLRPLYEKIVSKRINHFACH